MDGNQIKNVVYVPAGTTQYNVKGDDDIINVDTSGGAVLVCLPNIIGAGLDLTPKTIFVNDFTGNAATNNITIICPSGNRVNAGSQAVLNTAYANGQCVIAGREQWLVNSESSQGGGGGQVTTINYDLTGTNDIDLSSYTGELIINLSNSSAPAAATLNTLSNFTNVTKITIRPVAALTLTVNDALTSGLPSIKLNAPSLVVYGPYTGFLTLEKRGSAFYQTAYVDQYNS